MAEIVVMCGLPGAGKSSYASEHYHDYLYLSSDAIRDELGITTYTKEDNGIVFDTMFNNMEKAMSEGRSIVFDATSAKRKDRLHLLAKIYKWGFDYTKTLVWLLVSRDMCIERDATRPHPVGQEVIDRMYHRFDIPAKYEGWDKIVIEATPDPQLTEFYKAADMDHFNQHNSHHTHTLGKHMAETAKYVMTKRPIDVNLATAALFHDVGKVKTQSFVNSKGETTKDAHYYDHHHVGAYDMALYLYMDGSSRDIDILDVCDLINMHMDPIIVWPRSKRKFNQFIALAGKEQMARVLLLSEADSNSR